MMTPMPVLPTIYTVTGAETRQTKEGEVCIANIKDGVKEWQIRGRSLRELIQKILDQFGRVRP